jgi:hypothetical protein
VVITDNKGNILDQGKANDLITQYPVNLKNEFDESFRVSYKKGNVISDIPQDPLTPQSAAFSNPDGARSPVAQTEGVPNHSFGTA